MIKKKTKPLLLCTEVYDLYLLYALFNSRKVLVFFFLHPSDCLWLCFKHLRLLYI